MITILHDIRETDRLNIIVFNNLARKWRNTLQVANEENILNCQQFVENIVSRGGVLDQFYSFFLSLRSFYFWNL